MKKTILAISIIMSLNAFAEEQDYTTIETQEQVLDINDSVSGGIITVFNMLKGNTGETTVQTEYVVDEEMKAKLEKFKQMLNEKLRSDQLKQTFHFKTASYELLEDQINYLKNIVLSLDNYQDLKYELVGYSDVRGNAEYNAELSLNRINSVFEVLNSLNVSNENIMINNLGESQSKETKEFEEYFFDRKVELVITK